MSQIELARRPITSYRLQLHAGFGFREAGAIVPYLARLGVTECYSSPQFAANPGSSHGYDICDHDALNPELGTEADFDEFCRALQTHGLGQIVDIVPNHMAADPRSNPWWRDVLENGPSSPFAEYFDIDWEPIKPELKDKVLLPVLGDQYGRALERGELQLDLQDGALHLRYFDLDLPINPRQAPRVLGLHLDELESVMRDDAALREYLSILTALRNLPAYTERDARRIVERHREKEVARERLARLVAGSASIRQHVDVVVTEANGTPGDRGSFNRLHELLEHQAYRLAYWRTAFDEINYRRFFDVNELVAIRMDTPPVFNATHGLVRRLIAEGKITGLRVDHPDGLGDPAVYFERLQEMTGGKLYVVAEKILSPGEELQRDWRVAGTTGYGFLNAVAGLFVHPRHVRQLRQVYTRMTGQAASFDEIAYQSRITIMLTSMASELNVLAHALNRISETDRRSRDFTLNSCRRVLREVTACFPVYRTYISGRDVSAVDREVLDAAIGEARRRNPVMEASIFEFLREVLVSRPEPDHPSAAASPERLRFAMQMQQFTAPVQAKGVEDTAFYRYHVLVSANDVGGHPARLAVGAEEFHEANRRRLADWPLELLATATHDTKRGEDARARISVLSEVPDDWRRAVAAWMRINGRNRVKIDGEWAPDRNDEYLFYQTLIGAWPCELRSAEIPEKAAPELVDRLNTYMGKAIREAKVHTSWIHENVGYNRAVSRFVTDSLESRNATRFLALFVPFQRRVAHAGMVNSLAQLVLKVASPGVPDFYQGVELWDLSLVDPDNRRPVDFAARLSMLDRLQPTIDRLESGEVVAGEVSDLLGRWVDGHIKLFVTAAALRFRRRHHELWLGGAYQPLVPEGPFADHVVGFAHRDGTGTLLVIVPRFLRSLTLDADALPRGRDTWGTTRVALPDVGRARFRHVLTGEIVEVVNGALALADVFRTLPVALLWQETRS